MKRPRRHRWGEAVATGLTVILLAGCSVTMAATDRGNGCHSPNVYAEPRVVESARPFSDPKAAIPKDSGIVVHIGSRNAREARRSGKAATQTRTATFASELGLLSNSHIESSWRQPSVDPCGLGKASTISTENVMTIGPKTWNSGSGQSDQALVPETSSVHIVARDTSNNQSSPYKAPEPSQVPEVASASTISGNATWYDWRAGQAAAGPGLRKALGPHWRGQTVTVCHGKCIVVKLTDWCACRNGQRLIDLDDQSFAKLAPLSAGVIPVTIKIGQSSGPEPAPNPTAPATDVEVP